MANLLIAVLILLLTFGRIISIRTISTREAAAADSNEAITVSLLVTFNEKCTAIVEGIKRDVIDHVIQMCNCTVINSSLQCCIEHHAVYKLTLSQALTNMCTTLNPGSTHVVMVQQCCYGNCTCDSNSASSSNQQVMLLILEIICGCLLLLVLLTVSFICYKCYRLCHQEEKVISMTPCPAPLPSNSSRQWLPIRQHLQRVAMATGSSGYIEPSEIVSPTLPPTLHHSNNHSSNELLATGSVTAIEQSTANNAQSTTVDIQSTTVDIQSSVDMQSTVRNMESIANSSTITQLQPDSNGYVDHSIATEHQQSTISSLRGKITTPNGLVATIKIPTALNGVTETGILSSELIKQSTATDVQSLADVQSTINNMESITNSSTITQQQETCNIISSKHYPGYIEHTIK